MEAELGIQLFTSPSLPFSGILKQRYSDFVVREIVSSTNGPLRLNLSEVEAQARLLEDTYFKKPAKVVVEGIPAVAPHDAAKACYDNLLAAFGQELTKTESTSLQEFITYCCDPKASKQDTIKDEWIGFPCASKELRGKLHAAVKLHAASTHLESMSVQLPNQTADNSSSNLWYIKLMKRHGLAHTQDAKSRNANQRSGNQAQSSAHASWPAELADKNYLSFTLLKENIDTMSAMHALSKQLHCKLASLAFNGTKDKRAVTTQQITLYRRRPMELVQRINGCLGCGSRGGYSQGGLHLPGGASLKVGNFQFVTEPARLGKLLGNQFEIILRDIQYVKADDLAGDLASSADNMRVEQQSAKQSAKQSAEQSNSNEQQQLKAMIEQVCQSVQVKGFINYFGLQRFGGSAASTAAPGAGSSSHRGGGGSHMIGRAIYQHNWKLAIDLLFYLPAHQLHQAAATANEAADLTSQAEAGLTEEQRKLLQAKRYYHQGDYKLALQMLPCSAAQGSNRQYTYGNNKADNRGGKEGGGGGGHSHHLANERAVLEKLVALQKQQQQQQQQASSSSASSSATSSSAVSSSAAFIATSKLDTAKLDYMNAFHMIDKSTRLMYCHAYQSYLWNHAVSERLRRFGMDQVVVGDLVIVKQPSTGHAEGEGEVDLEEMELADQAVDEEVDQSTSAEIGEPEQQVADTAGPSTNKDKRRSKQLHVHIITEADLAQATQQQANSNSKPSSYTIFDVVLPLLGSASLLPAHSIGDYLLEKLHADGLLPSPISATSSSATAEVSAALTTIFGSSCHPSYQLDGSYRRILTLPSKMQYQLIDGYMDPDQELAETEMTQVKQQREEKRLARQQQQQDGQLEDGQYNKRKFADVDQPKQPDDADADADNANKTKVTKVAITAPDQRGGCVKEETATTDLTSVKAAADQAAEQAAASNSSQPVLSMQQAQSKSNNSRSMLALKLQFALSPGSYATMLLREITKQSTETSHHAKLTNSNNNK